MHIVSAAHQCQSEQPALARSVRTVVAGLAQMTSISRITRFGIHCIVWVTLSLMVRVDLVAMELLKLTQNDRKI